MKKTVLLIALLVASLAYPQEHRRRASIDTLFSKQVNASALADTGTRSLIIPTTGGWDIAPALVLPDSAAYANFLRPWSTIQGSLYRSGNSLLYNTGAGVVNLASGGGGSALSILNLGGMGLYKNTSGGLANFYGLSGSSDITLTQNATTVGIGLASNVAKHDATGIFSASQWFTGPVNSILAIQGDGQTGSNAIAGAATVGVGVNGTTGSGIGVKGTSGGGIAGYFQSTGSGSGILVEAATSGSAATFRVDGATKLQIDNTGITGPTAIFGEYYLGSSAFSTLYVGSDGRITALAPGSPGAFLRTSGTSGPPSWSAAGGGSGGWPVPSPKDSTLYLGGDSAFHHTVKISSSPGGGLVDSGGSIISRGFVMALTIDSSAMTTSASYDIGYTFKAIIIDSISVVMVGGTSPSLTMNVIISPYRNTALSHVNSGGNLTPTSSTTLQSFYPDTNSPFVTTWGARQFLWVVTPSITSKPKSLVVYIQWHFG